MKNITNDIPATSELLDARVVRSMLMVDRSTVYRMAQDGRLPAVKVGRQWRFPAAAIDQWLRDNGLLSSAPPPAPIANPNHSPAGAPLSDMLPLECVQLIQDTFAEAIGAMAVITDMEGKPVTRVSNPCGLMAALEDAPDLWEQCVAHWRRMAGTIELEPRFVEGPLGLLCARGLIRAGAELKGIVFIGGFAPDCWPPTAERVAEMARGLRVPDGRVSAHLNEVYQLDPAGRERVLVLVQRVANIISHIISERGRLLAGAGAAAHFEEHRS